MSLKLSGTTGQLNIIFLIFAETLNIVIMKKILFLLLLSVCFIASSCSKDEGESTPSYSIVGVWKRAGNLLGVYQFNTDKTYIYWTSYYNENVFSKEPREKGTYTFDGKYLSLDGDFKKEVEFSEDGTKIKIDNESYQRVK